ncbi:MAG: S1C family serine protease [Ktedonobacterales bacterium]
MTIPIELSEALAGLATNLRESVVQVQAGERGIGSGIIWQVDRPASAGDPEATIITNAHVVRAGHQDTFKLKLATGQTVLARVTDIKPEYDLAALRVNAPGLRPAEIGDSSALRVGELVMAIGNPFGREGAVTIGVVAARAPADEAMSLEPAEAQVPGDRNPRMGAHFHGIEVIQADIRLYPGNSGGPLVDAHGHVVGVNAMVGGGLGFAIPSRVVRQFLLGLDQQTEPVYLGVEVLTVPLSPALRQRAQVEQEFAVLITGVAPDSPAESAGLLPGDALLALDGHTIRDARLLSRLLNNVNNGAASGISLTLSVLRAGERLELSLMPAVRKAA